MIHFITGGARSGKSRYAQTLTEQAAAQSVQHVHYIATATPLDEEMQLRIARHRQDRPSHWQTVEAPLLLAEALAAMPADDIVLTDCLTLWLNNQLYHYPGQDFTALFSALTDVLSTRTGPTFVVANEVGLGVIPADSVSRRFVDLAGWLNQTVAAAADNVTFVAAGLPLSLKKGTGQ